MSPGKRIATEQLLITRAHCYFGQMESNEDLATTSPPKTRAALRRGSATAASLVVVVGLLMQGGSALAVMVIDSVGVAQALWLRTALAAIVLAAVRPRMLGLPARGNRLLLLALTASLLAMNFSFYEAISRAPVGIVVAVEFLGPLAVAIAGSRRLVDFMWVVLAGAGVFLLARTSGSVTAWGLVFAFVAASCWASFILLAKRAVSRMEPFRVTMLMLGGAAVVLTPVMLATGVKFAGHGKAILLGFAVAMLSSAIPYFLELVAIQRVRAATYGVLLSIEPAIAAFWGFIILSQALSLREMLAIAAIVVAAAGASWVHAQGAPLPARTSRNEGNLMG
ncbi:MAG: EamA family transporter [Actinobacteria bacterium]|nr:EamA family transporter [Actinomycetota bacterium]